MANRQFLLTMLWCGQKWIRSRPWEQDSASTRSNWPSEPSAVCSSCGSDRTDDAFEVVLDIMRFFFFRFQDFWASKRREDNQPQWVYGGLAGLLRTWPFQQIWLLALASFDFKVPASKTASIVPAIKADLISAVWTQQRCRLWSVRGAEASSVGGGEDGERRFFLLST